MKRYLNKRINKYTDKYIINKFILVFYTLKNWFVPKKEYKLCGGSKFHNGM